MLPKRLPPLSVLRLLCRLGPICCALFMVTFQDRFFLFTILYLAAKDCSFGNATRCGVIRCLNNILSLCISSSSSLSFTIKYFFNNWARYWTKCLPLLSLFVETCLFCMLSFRLPPIYQAPRLTDYLLFILKSRPLLAICYKFYERMRGLVTKHIQILTQGVCPYSQPCLYCGCFFNEDGKVYF